MDSAMVCDIKASIDEMMHDVCALIHPRGAIRIAIDNCGQPAEVDYDTRAIHINSDWIQRQVQLKHPAAIRALLTYYVYGLELHAATGQKIPDYNPEKSFLQLIGNPQNLPFIPALTQIHALASLKGIPVPKELLIPDFVKAIPGIIKNQLGIDTAFIPTMTVTQQKSYGLAPAGEYKNKLNGVISDSQKASQKGVGKTHGEKCGINGMGTKANPFANINEAFDAILKAEKEAIDADPWLNSDFIRSPFPPAYCGRTANGESLCHYKVKWAIPQVAHLPNSFDDSHFIFSGLTLRPEEPYFLRMFEARNVGPVPRFCLKPNLKNRKFLFRGQNMDYGSCLPNLHRDGVRETMEDEIKVIEMQCAIVNHPLVRLLGIDGIEVFNEPFRLQINLKGLMQHYYNKTSCLDLTSDVEAAKFFAVTNTRINPATGDDEYFVYTPSDHNEPGVIYFYEMQLPGAFQPYGNNFSLSPMGKQFMFGRSGQQHGFLLDIPRGSDFMDSPYARAVYFRHDPKISQEIFEHSGKGYKYYPKNDILRSYWKRLDAEWKTTHMRTISRKTFENIRFHEWLDGKKPSSDQALRRRLAACRIKVGQSKYPRFPKDAIQEFLKDMDNGWWHDEFCADIHFVGDEGVFMQRAFRELPLTDYYRRFVADYKKSNNLA